MWTENHLIMNHIESASVAKNVCAGHLFVFIRQDAKKYTRKLKLDV